MFNADPVKRKINKNREAIAFIDDYSAWVTSPSIESNINLLQFQIIPHVKSWAKASGAIFQAKKTYITHFTNNKRVVEKQKLKQITI